MVFSSLYFLACFLPVFIIFYNLLPRNRTAKNAAILIASIFFYAWGGPKFIFVILGVTLLDSLLVGQMDKQETAGKRKLFLLLSLSLNVGFLFYFKYLNFFVDNANALTGIFGAGGIHIARILLPIGISFYTFESITYAVDVYRRVHKPLQNFWEYQLYIIFFPKLIAGPIVRYHEISDQISDHIAHETAGNKLHGFVQFCIGLGKKVLIANIVGRQADLIFSLDPHAINTTAAWIGALAYTFQIYFDFSGYSDMAIGIGRMLGFRLPENFNNPYTATSITDFWRKWHITLGAWMRNYIYIPLGGNQTTRAKLYRNLAIVFLISGLWHGASWNFVLWGAFHGLFIVLDRIFLLKVLRAVGRIPAVLITFLLVVVSWVIFRHDGSGNQGLSNAFAYIKRMFAFDFRADGFIVTQNDFNYVVFAAVFFSFFALLPGARKFQEKLFHAGLKRIPLLAFTITGVVLYGLCLAYVSASSFNPFIYFKF